MLMEFVVIGARLVLVVTLLVSGVAKLVAPGTAEALRAFGVPRWLAPTAGVALPAAEIVAAGLLLPGATVAVGAALSVALLSVFTAGIAVNMALGRDANCPCFGELTAGRVGRLTLARNGALLALAVTVLAAGAGTGTLIPRLDAPMAGNAWSAWFLASAVLNLLLLGAIGLGLWRLRRWQQTVGNRLDELDRRVTGDPARPPRAARVRARNSLRGSPAPALTVTDFSGEPAPLIPDGTKLPTLLVFTDVGCKPCDLLLPDVARWQQESARRLTVTVISRGTLEQNRRLVDEHGLTNVLLQRGFEVADAFNARGTPAGLLVDRSRRIASEVVVGGGAIRALYNDVERLTGSDTNGAAAHTPE